MKSKLKNINSNTGKFIDGNPTSGELGTIVTAEWLNGVQERVQDTFEELKNVLALGNLQPDGNKTTQVADAIRAYVQTFNLKIESNTRSLANVIPNSKKSSAVNSNSADTVATSAAVKTAYDKGVEAKNAADGAQRTANESVSKATTAQTTANSAVTKADNAQRAADNANNNANNRVSKSGDTMTGNLAVPNLIVNDPTNNNNFVQIGDDTKLIDVDMGHTVGLQTTDNANDAYIAYGTTKKRFGFDGVNFSAESGLGAQWFGSQKRGEGAYVNQWRTEAPYHVQAGNANGSNTYFPYLKGKVTNGDGWGAAFSFGYTTPGTRNQFGTGIIHLIEDNGSEKKWEFAHNGNFISAADMVTGSGKSLNNTHQQSYDYVQVTGSVSYGGLNILKPDGKSMRFEREGNAFKFWCQDMYSILMPQRGGTVLLDTDFSHVTNGTNKTKVASEFALGELSKQLKTVVRKDYSRTIKGTRANFDNGTNRNISVTGYTVVYPDGKIEQYFHFRNFRINWFDLERHYEGERIPEIPLQLWTAMPNKIEWVEAHISRTNDTSIFRAANVASEASEWKKPIWAFDKQGSTKDRLSLYVRRNFGTTDEPVDMFIKVEGY